MLYINCCCICCCFIFCCCICCCCICCRCVVAALLVADARGSQRGETNSQPRELSLVEVGISQPMSVDLHVSCFARATAVVEVPNWSTSQKPAPVTTVDMITVGMIAADTLVSPSAEMGNRPRPMAQSPPRLPTVLTAASFTPILCCYHSCAYSLNSMIDVYNCYKD